MSNPIPAHILKINSSGRNSESYSRKLVDRLVAKLSAKNTDVKVTERDTSAGIDFVDERWITSSFTPADARTADQEKHLTLSNELVDELIAADTLVIGVAMYNFAIPASLKAWLDQVVRPGRTFHYSDTGPQGLLTDKKVYVVLATGGTEAGGEMDYASGYLRHILGFMGITDVEIIAADQLMMGDEAKLAKVHELIEAA